MDNRLENAHSYAEYKALAPMMMDDLTHLIQVFRHGGGKLYHGIKVIFDFRWEEFTTLTERPPNFGSYDVRIQFGTSPTSAVPGQEILKKVGAADPWRAHRIALGTEVRQTLLLFRRKSKKILRGLQRLETERQLSCSGKKSKGHSSSGNKDGTPGESNAKQQTAERLKPAASSPRTLEMVCSNVQLIHQAGGSCLSFSLTNSAPKAAVPCIPPPNHEHDAMIAWTKNKMQELIRHFEEEKDTSKAKGHVKPLVFRHYIEKRKPSARARVQPMSMSPGVSAARMANMAPTSKVRTPRKDKMPKFLVALPDGAIFIYYPSGHIAACQISHYLGHTRTYTFLFEDSQPLSMVASFINDGQGCVYYTNRHRCSLAMLVNGEGGVLRDVDGWVAHHWDWASTNPPLQSLDYKINTNLRLHIDGAGSMTLLFNSFNDAVSLPLMSNLSTFTGHPILSIKHHERGGYEEHTAAAGIKKLFQQTVHQYVRSLLIGAGALSTDHTTKPKPQSSQNMRQMESLNKAEAQAMGHTTKADFTKMVESILKVSRRSSSLGLPRRPQQDRMDTDRRKSSSRAASQPRMLAPFYLRCPEVLRQWLKGHHEGIECHCTKGIPTITDFEFNTFMEAWRGGPAQILVLIIVSSQKPTLSAKLEEFTHNMYITAQRGRLAPCIKMYRGGKLLFGGSTFNGYGCTKKDLLRQIARANADYKMTYFLPDNFKFSSTVP